jgi:hypothetical protein
LHQLKPFTLKKQILTSIVSFMLLINFTSCSANSSAAQKDSTLKDYPPSHPRILLLEGEESGIRQTIAADDDWNAMHVFILSESDKLLTKAPVERELIGKRLLDKSREALRRIFFLSYSYRMTNDQKYLMRAEQELNAVSAFSDWNPSHFLDVAEMTMAAAIGYDWLFKGLSAESRSHIKTAIVEKGLKPSFQTSYNSWLQDSNNWNQVCNAGMTFGALAVYEDEKELATKVIERAVSSIKLPENDYNPDGAYPEGYGYWGYGTSFNVMFLSTMKKAFGSTYDLSTGDGFFKTASYLENMIGPAGLPFNYTDCGTSASMNPAMFWFANNLNDPSILWSEKYLLAHKSLPNDRFLPAVLIWGAGMPLSKITAPIKNIWVGQGKNPVALIRTSWSDPNAIFIGLKTGSPSVNHAHMDVGSFVMDANGERWAMDFGMQDYNSLESAGVDLWNMSQTSQRWSVFRYNNMSHNTLTVNNQYQKVSGKASVISYSGEPGMMNAETDLSSVYSGQLSCSMRGVAIVDGKYAAVRDEIRTLSAETVIRWNLVTSASVTITGSNSAELVKNGKKLVMKVLEPAKVTMKTWSTDPPNTYDAANPGTIMTGFEATIPANSSAVLSVILLPDGAAENKVISGKTLSEWPK